jgi:1-acyl-sn-glycerol-3-phosphate acyltransferase
MKKLLATLLLRLTGWRRGGAPPPLKRFVLIAAPHTSNWDAVYLLAFGAVYDLEISWLMKQEHFRWPIGLLYSALGGIPVDRSARRDRVAHLAGQFGERERLVVVVPPEGTRRRAEHWKSGFFHLALQADVPIVCSYLDYTRKIGGFGPVLQPTDGVGAVMDACRAFYADKEGRFPDQFGPVQLFDEAEEALRAAAP